MSSNSLPTSNGGNGSEPSSPNNNHNRSGSVMFSGDLNQQAVTSTVQREIYKQLELLLLKKKAGNGKVTIKAGLLVTIPQVERVSALSSFNVNHNIENISNILVHLSKGSLHAVLEILIKMSDTYVEEYEALQGNKNTRAELPSFKDETVESDTEPTPGGTTSSTNLTLVTSPSITSPTLSSSNSSINNSGDINESSISSPNMISSQSSPSLANTSSNSLQIFQRPTFKQISEDTALYHLLNIIYSILQSHQIDKFSNLDDKSTQLATLPPKIITFFFSLLQYNYSPAIRYKSASCLQIISLVSLEAIAQIYVTKLQSGKSDDFYREYSTIQKSAKYLEFGFHRASQIEGTSQYFAKILIEMEKVSRAVFIQSMCYTIIKAFPKMFNSATVLSQVPEHFWSIITKMYDIILKWTKKSKLKFICIKALFAMVGCNAEFFTSKGNELLQILSSSFKETNNRGLRKAYLECLVQYVNITRSLFGQEAKAPFYQQQLDTIIPVILPKKSTPSPIEQPIILEILLSMGRFSLSIVVNKYILSILTVGGSSASSSGTGVNSVSSSSLNLASKQATNEFTLESRAIIFKMLFKLNQEFNDNMRYYDRTLWALLDNLFSIYDGESTPMKHLLLLFPTFCSHENLKEIADKISKWTWHQEYDIATMSTVGITKYLSNQPHTTFPGILLQMLTFITNYSGDLSGLCKVIKNMSMIMQEFINLHYHSNKERSMNASSGIDAITWKNLRDTCEGISIYLLSSSMAPIWSEVFAFIQLTGHEIFREIDSVNPTPYLADYLPSSESPHYSNQSSSSQSGISQLLPSLNPDLTSFLQIHSIVFPNAVSWAWARLRKRWHPKTQAIGWKNNLAFLLLSLRLDSEHPELTSVEEQLLTDILNQYFQEREGKTNEECAQFIYELSFYLHPSCYDCIFKFIEQERSRDLKRKKKETFYTQDYVIIYASQLIDRLSVSDYDNIPSIRSALREMTYFWITNSQIFKDLSLNGKNHISRILKNFLILDSQSTIPKGEISLNKSSYTKLIFQCLQLLCEHFSLRDEVVLELEINTQKAIQTLISEADLTDFKLEIIPFAIRCFNIGQHIHSYLSETLSIFLRRSPKYLNEYIERSFDNEKSPIASLVFFKALVINFSKDFYSLWSHNCPPERLVHLCLFHMVSYDEEARNLSIKLANDLSMRDSQTDEITLLQPHFYVTSSRSLPLHIYLRSSLLYSNSMSSKYPWITPGLIEESNNVFKFLPFVHKQAILTLLAPWTRNFWWVLNVGEGLTDRHQDLMLESLFSLTIQARLSSTSNLTSIEVLWGELISSGDSKGHEAISPIVSKIVDFLRDKYSLLQPLSVDAEKELNYTNQDIKDTSRMVMSFISRRSSIHWSFVINHMIESLRYYKTLPSSPLQFITDYMSGLNSPTVGLEGPPSINDASDSFNTINEESILSFFEDLTFEFRHADVIQIVNLIPMLLCNVLYIYGPFTSGVSSVRLSSSNKIINNILLSLVIQQSNIDDSTKSEAMKLIEMVDTSKWKEKQIQQFIKIIQTSLGNAILDIWESYSLQFAIQCKDISVSLIALTWYSGIRSVLCSRKEAMEGLLGLSVGLWKSSLCGELSRSFKFLHTFIEIIEDQQQNHKSSLLSETSYAIIIRLGSILLHTSYLQQFKGILILLYKSIQSLQSQQTTQSKIIEEMIDILSAGMTAEQVVNRGIAHPQTSLLTLWFAKEVSNFWEKKKNYQSSQLTCSLMLSSSMLVSMMFDEPNTKEFIEYLFEAPVSSQLSNFLPLLYSYYHYNIAKTPGSTPPPSPKDLAKVLCRDLFQAFPNQNSLISDAIKSISEMIKSLLDVGKEDSCSFLLCFVNEIINGIAGPFSNHPSVSNINSQNLLDFSYLVIDLSQLSNSRATREEAQKIMPFILANIPNGLALGSFDFIKIFNNSQGLSNTTNNSVTKINCLFGSQSDQDISANTYTSLYLVNTYLYALPTDSQINSQMKSILESQIRDKLKSSTNSSSTNLNNISSITTSSNNQFTSFIFSFKKKADIPKPSEILHSSSNNIVMPPPPQYNNNNNNNNNNTTPVSSFILNKTKPPIPTTPPPSHIVKGSNLNISAPILPPKRFKPKSETINPNDLPPPPL